MATGDQNDIFGRLRKWLPAWFIGRSVDDVNPILDAILTGYAWGFALFHAMYEYAKLQTRIATATDGWLDLIASDFFGTRLPRNGLPDETFRIRIIASIFREQVTRKAIRDILFQLTGREPRIIEPTLPGDCGGYGVACGYGVAGGYGSLLHPYQAWVTAYRKTDNTNGNLNGWSQYAGGYGVGSIAWVDSTSLHGLRDADLYAAVDTVKAYGTKIWMNVSN